MPPIVGIRGTGSFTADERPKNWRDMILYLFPNGEAPLTAVMSKMASEATDDPEYNWWEKKLPTGRIGLAVNTNAVTTLALNTSPAGQGFEAVKGSVLMVETTGERMLVTADPVAPGNTLAVSRGFAGSTAAATAATDFAVVIGSSYPEGDDPPSSRAYSPTKLYNLTQIFRTTLSLTRTARKTRLRWDNTGPYREAKREALSLHSIEMEKAFIWGLRSEAVAANGHPQRTTGGVISYLATNIGTTDATFGTPAVPIGTLSELELDLLCQKIFKVGSTEKLVLAGDTFIRVITQLAKKGGAINLVPQDRTYGMKITEYLSAHGSLMLKQHPLMAQNPAWSGNALVVDTANLRYRYIDDTMFIKNRQRPGQDLALDEFLTECGLELNHEATFAYIQGVTGIE